MLLCALLACSESGPAPAAPPFAALGTGGGQWRSHGGDPGNSKYSPLSQIHRGNAAQLGIVWRWRSPDPADLRLPHPLKEGDFAIKVFEFQGTPLMVDGVLYDSTPLSRVFALDAATGRTLWVHDPRSYARGSEAGHLFPVHRGVAWWQSGREARIFTLTGDAYLLALDPSSGKPIDGFGDGGRVDLFESLRRDDVRRRFDYFHTSPPAIAGDVVIVGGSVHDRPTKRRDVPGDLRGFDARTGALLWTFHTVPEAGEPGVETWENDSWRDAGAANAWAPMAVDPELGLVYAQTGTPTSDFYGGHRPGDNLYAESLLCLEARTGHLVWHQQLVHHGLWDYDVSSPPNLVDIEVDGRAISAVAQNTKQGFTFVFDRRTGEPVWPIEERPAPRSDVPGERTSPTQRVPAKPPPIARQGTLEADLLDYTPELRERSLEIFRRYRTGPVFTPPSLEGTLTMPAPLGGANWHGAAFDPNAGLLFVSTVSLPTVLQLQPGVPGETEFDYTGTVGPVAGWRGLPLFKPPYSEIVAVDLRGGEIAWRVPNGLGPQGSRPLHEFVKGPMGAGAHACPLVTGGLVFAGGGSAIWADDRGEPTLGAYDKLTGEQVLSVRLPAKVRNCPITYEVEGRQLLVVAIGGPGVHPELIALGLPDTAD